MWSNAGKISTLASAAMVALAGCGAPGLPPAGPAPGEVEVGYGTQDKDEVTGAVTSVSENKLSESRPSSIVELLRGRVAGLQIVPRPEGGYSFRIRGLATTLRNEPPEPLFVVDGVQTSADRLETALAGLTRDDIRQVDVLKDIASTSIYGTRGAGGVIIITTKR